MLVLSRYADMNFAPYALKDTIHSCVLSPTGHKRVPIATGPALCSLIGRCKSAAQVPLPLPGLLCVADRWISWISVS